MISFNLSCIHANKFLTGFKIFTEAIRNLSNQRDISAYPAICMTANSLEKKISSEFFSQLLVKLGSFCEMLVKGSIS